ncbi:hypothetical protein GGX14DRAFT_401590 [Mycena pura]|uniref:Uncharacterized protein n=1 Tax=Mycena pura TaxID=153505 RepID=A0AAD6V0I8_9AGAR|nr:hypothetical protein GGX14DRAFT_401590 [Mycena pura]
MSRAQANLPSKSGLRKNIVCVRAAGELQNKAWLMLSIQFRNILVYTSEGVRARRCIILSSEECGLGMYKLAWACQDWLIFVRLMARLLTVDNSSALSIAASSLPCLGNFLFASPSGVQAATLKRQTATMILTRHRFYLWTMPHTGGKTERIRRRVPYAHPAHTLNTFGACQTLSQALVRARWVPDGFRVGVRHLAPDASGFASGVTGDPLVDTQVVYQSVFEVILTNFIRLEHGEITMIPDPNAPQWNARGVPWYPARFVRRHESRAGEDGEYEFEWLECMKGIVYHSSSSATLPSNLRTFCKGRKFCQAIHEVNDNLQSKQKYVQIGKVRLPFYMEPDHPSHKDPELERIFHAALPHVAKILATFPDDHPVIASFNKYFSGKKATEHHRGAGKWMRTLSLVPTPQLEAILEPSLQSLARHMHLVHVPEPELQRRLLGVGSALLQLLAVQRELGEALNLNGDVLQDLLTGRIVPRSFDGPEALLVMFKACMIADGSSVSATTRMLKFNEAHDIYDQDYSEPTFRRLAPSIFQPSAAIPVVLKRNGDENIVNEKPAKRTKTTKTQQKKKQTIESDMRGSRTTGRRLRSGKVV